MAKEFVGSAFLLGLIVLGAALFLPAMMDTTAEDAQTHIEAEVGEQENITKYLLFEVDDINTGQDGANTTLENSRTLDRESVRLNTSESKTVNLTGDTIKVNMTSVENGTLARYRLTYPPMFGWSDGPRTFFENLDIVLVLFGFTLIMLSLFGFAREI